MVKNYLKRQLRGYQIQLDRLHEDLNKYTNILNQTEKEIEGVKFIMRLVEEEDSRILTSND